MEPIVYRYLFSLSLLLMSGTSQAGDLQQLLQLIDDVGADYTKAVANNQVINPDEYEEMLDFSAGIRQLVVVLPDGDPRSNLQQQADTLAEQITGKAAAAEIRNLSSGAAFTAALFILLREGLESLLVVAALAAFLIKTKHRHNLRYLHYGWIGALLAGVLTWWASVSLIEVSGASREVTEGVAALLAAAVLFYVGFWLHDKTNGVRWKQFIESNVRRAMSSGTLWSLAGLSFLAVYREVFETILFYQALWVQTDQAGKSMATGGFLTGAAALVVLAWLVVRYSARLPLRQFFSVTGILMFVLALIFAGKGVAALQEAGYITVVQISIPRIELLGIYPNLYGLLLQLGLLLLALYLWFGLPGKRRLARD